MTSHTIFFIGPQGSGKGTQAKLLAQRLNYFHWDNGAICRQAATENTELGHKVKEMIDNGVYLDDVTLMAVAEEKLKSIPGDSGIIFDGIPRRLSQAEYLIKYLEETGRTDLTTIFLHVPKEETLTRLIKRAATEHRADDTPEKIERRLQQYYDETLPVIDCLRQHTTLLEIDGRPGIEEVTANIHKALGI